MPTKDAEKINAVAYIDGRPIGGDKRNNIAGNKRSKGEFYK